MGNCNVSYGQMMIRKVIRRFPVSHSNHKLYKFLFFGFVLSVLVVLALFVRFYRNCSTLIESHLTSQKWSLPSTIYADAPVLYQGMILKPEKLVEYLERLSYQKTTRTVDSGQYSVSRGEIAFQKHSQFPGTAGKFPVTIQFSGNQIEKILNRRNGDDLAAFEMEPVAISNLFGEEWEKRTVVPYKEISPYLIQAVVAIEDRRFFTHRGIDVKAILRAIINDVFNKKQLQGGSTITQQLAKNFYLTPERSIRRKVSEAVMAWILERRLKKEEILELYLNEIYLGQRGAMSINGVEEASRLLFRKEVKHLTVPEAALLAGLIQAPNSYNPYRHPAEATVRRNTVLRAMSENGSITQTQYENYIQVPLQVYPFDTRINLAPYFGFLVKNQLLEKYDQKQIYTRNLQIFTTLDLDMQRIAEEALTAGLTQIDKIRIKKAGKPVEGCLIAIEPQTGYIRAFVGGRSYTKSQFDRVTQAARQPGSIFKPVVYAAAFEQSFQKHDRIFTPATVIVDEPWTLKYSNKTWEPKNYDGQYHGAVTLRSALAQSLNVATAKLAQEVGILQVTSLAKRLGLGDVKPYPSIALGAFEVTPWQVATAYTVFANGGVKTELRTVKKVQDAEGKTLDRSQIDVRTILRPQTAYLITTMLQTVLSQGTGAPVRNYGFSKTAAGKTGTTDEYRDAWFVGYTPNLLCVVWTGYDDNTPIKMTGAQAALPIWARFMKEATAGLPDEEFSSPHGVVVRMVDPSTGGLATEDCPGSIPEFFIEGTEPTQACQEHSKHWWNIFG